MFSSALAISLAFSASAVAQSSGSAAVVCVAGQCLQGLSNTTIGATLSAPGTDFNVQLLPGQYSSTTNPQLLHNMLTTSSAKLSPSAGFSNTTGVSLPLNLALQPGMAVYPNSLYSGQPSFSQLPNSSNASSSSSLSAGSIALSSNVWAALGSGSGNNTANRLVVWSSIPDVTQLPSSNAGPFSLLAMQSTACSPPCSGNGVCSSSGTCTCPTGFNGTSCESCAAGFFGPTCQPCPSGCTTCDQGISGTGRCLSAPTASSLATCNCLNGECGGNGQCTCNTGWTTADNGTACAKCQPGFFLNSDGDCKICSIGCQQCADGTGDCTTCKSGFTQDANDRTKCDATQQTTSGGTVCPDGSFSDGTNCQPCSSSCSTCNGGTSNNCVLCASGSFSFNGSCVTTDGNGVCQGTDGLIANNNNKQCDTCGAKCTSCAIPSFNVASTINQLQCTGCLPGSVLSQGKCVDSCPSGTFLSPKDNLTCTACDSSCSTCTGSADFCLTCANNQLASQGKCVSSCPTNTFSSSGSCFACHPDCASCSGGAFNQCSSCNANLPVLSSGRCLPTCSQAQFFDKSSSSCQSCDSSCSSCSGSGPNNCLTCSSASQKLQGGACVSASCNGSSSVIPGLGVCLSDLVAVQPTGTGTSAPQPSITGIDSPTVVQGSRRLEWWEILLMALGCASIFVFILWCWRRRMRKVRAKRTQQFAQAKALHPPTNWRWRLVRFGEKLFGHNASRRVDLEQGDEELRMLRMRNAERERHEREMEKIMDSYAHSHHSRLSADANSLYSQVTGVPRRGPDPRQPVKDRDPHSRFSVTTHGSGSSKGSSHSAPGRSLTPTPPSEAEAYANTYKVQPTYTGSSSKNPFRR